MRVCAVIVTFNRLALLREAVARVRSQTRPPQRIVIVDNRSTDDTWATIRDWAAEDARIVGLRTRRNLGGAGGFAIGMHRALQEDADATWVLDDDTHADPDCLAQLVDACTRYADDPDRPVFASSAVRWQDDLPHPMNWPNVMHGDRHEQALFSRCLLHGHAPLRAATYVSTLFDNGRLRQTALPCLDYFIWSDDIEHTLRLTADGRFGIYVPASRALHATAAAHTCLDASPERFYNHVRNGLWNILKNPAFDRRKRTVWFIFHWLSIWRYLRRQGFRPAVLRPILRGALHGLSRRPRPNPPLDDLIAESVGPPPG